MKQYSFNINFKLKSKLAIRIIDSAIKKTKNTLTKYRAEKAKRSKDNLEVFIKNVTSQNINNQVFKKIVRNKSFIITTLLISSVLYYFMMVSSASIKSAYLNNIQEISNPYFVKLISIAVVFGFLSSLLHSLMLHRKDNNTLMSLPINNLTYWRLKLNNSVVFSKSVLLSYLISTSLFAITHNYSFDFWASNVLIKFAALAILLYYLFKELNFGLIRHSRTRTSTIIKIIMPVSLLIYFFIKQNHSAINLVLAGVLLQTFYLDKLIYHSVKLIRIDKLESKTSRTLFTNFTAKYPMIFQAKLLIKMILRSAVFKKNSIPVLTINLLLCLGLIAARNSDIRFDLARALVGFSVLNIGMLCLSIRSAITNKHSDIKAIGLSATKLHVIINSFILIFGLVTLFIFTLIAGITSDNMKIVNTYINYLPQFFVYCLLVSTIGTIFIDSSKKPSNEAMISILALVVYVTTQKLYGFIDNLPAFRITAITISTIIIVSLLSIGIEKTMARSEFE